LFLSKSVESSSGRFFDEGGLERRTFLPDKSRAWIRACRTPRRFGHFGFMWFTFVMLFFAYRLLLTPRWKLEEVSFTTACIVHNSTVGEVKELIQDTQEEKPESEIVISFFSWKENLMVSARFLSLCSLR